MQCYLLVVVIIKSEIIWILVLDRDRSAVCPSPVNKVFWGTSFDVLMYSYGFSASNTLLLSQILRRYLSVNVLHVIMSHN